VISVGHDDEDVYDDDHDHHPPVPLAASVIRGRFRILTATISSIMMPV